MLAIGVTIALLAGATPTIPDREPSGLPHLRSESVLVRYADNGEVLLSKNPEKVRPIASVTKLLTALVLLDDDVIASTATVTITQADKDRLKWSRSRLNLGRTFTRRDLFKAALVASDNRAVYALVRSLGMTREAFAARMNERARVLGMRDSRFVDPAGISPDNVSSARDLVRLVDAVATSTTVSTTTRIRRIEIESIGRGTMRLGNPNRLIHSRHWDVVVGKTGYTVEAGRTLALRVRESGRPIDMIFLGSREMMSVFGDAGRVRRWLERRRTAAAAAP